MSYHLYHIHELFSDTTGNIQFIEMAVGPFNNESFWEGEEIWVEQGDLIHSLAFPSDLPSRNTANTSVLLATQGFANLGIVTPDFIIPDSFLFTQGEATVHFEHVDSVTYSNIPLNGVQSIDHDGVLTINSPKNFAGVSGIIPSNLVLGTDQAEALSGTAANDVILGLAGNDRINGLSGDDTLDGNDGIDTAIYSDHSQSYAITNNTALNQIIIAGPEGSDELFNTERIEFQDKALAFDLAQNQSAGNTVRIIGAAFDASTITPDLVALGLRLFDNGKSLLDVSELIIHSTLFQSMAGSITDEDFVSLVYANVVGHEPNPTEIAYFTGLLQNNGGSLSKAELLILAANTEQNESNINLVGLVQYGAEFNII